MIPGKQYTPELMLDIARRHRWRILVPAVLFAARLIRRYTDRRPGHRELAEVVAARFRVQESLFAVTLLFVLGFA